MENRFIFLFLIFIVSSCQAQSSSEIRTYIERYKQIALEQEHLYGIPASITLAQGILESGAGKSALTRKSNNHFGIKKNGGWTGPVFYAWDDDPQQSPFRCYSSPEESFRDHSKFLKDNSRYNSLFNISPYNYRAWAIGLQNAGYATSPTYAKGLIGYIDAYRLYAINGGVKLKGGKTITIVRTITREEIVQRKDIQMDEEEESEEEETMNRAMQRFVTDINDVRCAILYPGESLSSIATKYGIEKSKLLEYNEVTDEKSFKEGDIVFVERKKRRFEGPHYETYRVREGETLYQISQMFGIRLASLCKMNKVSIFDTLDEGKELRLK